MEALPKLLAPWPIPRTPNWIERVNQPLSERELHALRECIGRVDAVTLSGSQTAKAE